MRLPFTHPSLASLSAFVAEELAPTVHGKISAHLQQCSRCQQSLRFIHEVNGPAIATPPAEDTASDALLERIMQARASGDRTILPVAFQPVASKPRRPWLGVAAAAVVLISLARMLAAGDAMASGDEGVLTLTPDLPEPGETVRVHYVPSMNNFIGAQSLRLRARSRRSTDESYSVPASQMRALSVLTRADDGAFVGSFVVPDSTVFAVLAVEGLDSVRVDDNSSRGWEMLVRAPNGSPLFASLFQRSEDMMGRSWEQGYAAIMRATELYPDSLAGWMRRDFFEQSLFKGAAGDSIRAVRSATIDSLIILAKDAPYISYDVIGAVFYRAQAAERTAGATPADSAEWKYWMERLQRTFPKHEQLAQRFAFWIDWKALGESTALDSLERLYEVFSPLTGPGNNLINVALSVARQRGDADAERRWTERAWRGDPDSARRVSTFLAGRTEYRDEGMRALRILLQDTTLRGTVTRPLARNAQAQWRAVGDVRQSLFAALGKALVVSGNTLAALDTLRLAEQGGWNPALYRDLMRTYLQAGDTASATAISARLVADGRTSDAQRDSLVRAGERLLGADAFSRALLEARRDMHERLLERSLSRGISPDARITTRDGQKRSLSDITQGKSALVIFWSRFCGPALDAVPEIASLMKRLEASGTPVAFVIDESPSGELDKALTDHGITWPVHYDGRSSLADAMRNFGTPHYYVIDRNSRIRFTGVEQIGDLFSRLEAVAAQDGDMR